jgi:hypothetical protein
MPFRLEASGGTSASGPETGARVQAPNYSLQPWFPAFHLIRAVPQPVPLASLAAIFGWTMSAINAVLGAMMACRNGREEKYRTSSQSFRSAPAG